MNEIRLALVAGAFLSLALPVVSTAEAQTCVAPPTGLVSWWTGDGNASDIAGPNDGTLHGVAFADGQVDRAFVFGGVGTYVDFGTPSSLMLNDPVTIELWFKKSAVVEAGFPALIAGGTNGWVLGVTPIHVGSNRLFVSKSGQPPYLVGETVLVNNEWYHVAVVRDGDTTTLFLNGTVDGIVLESPEFEFASPFRLFLDSNPAAGTATFPGLIDEVAIYDRALTDTDIGQIFLAGLDGKCKASPPEDTMPPVIRCNAPATITPPDAPISFTATGTDLLNPLTTTMITGYDCSMVNGSGKLVDKEQSCVVQFSGVTVQILDSGGVGDHITWTVESTDGVGNRASATCAVDVVNPGRGRR